MAQENESLEFGQVLKDSDTGWEQVESIGSMRKEFGDASFCYSVNRHGIKYLEIFERPLSESVIFEVDDENQVLRIVAAIEGTDKWRTMESCPVGKLIELLDNNEDKVIFAVWDGYLMSSPDGVPLFRNGSSESYLTTSDFDAWRIHNPAHWEVSE